MASKDKEIEIKIPVDEILFLRIKEKLSKEAKFVKKTSQTDEYFTPFHRNFVEQKFPFEWLSIRQRGDKNILNYKHFHPEHEEVHTHCDEFESEIQDLEKIKRIFSALDFKKLVTVEKQREVFICEDRFEIALDIVKELGYFIEIEALKEIGSIEETRKKLFEFAEGLGMDISKADLRGYPYLMMEKNGLIK